jgi:hypothetical protein
VVNDGSSDEGKTAAIAKTYGEKIKYYEKENGGVASALNYGIEKMSGVYFSWLSHDDLYSPHKISKQIEYLDTHVLDYDSTILFSNYNLIDVDGNIFYTANLNPGDPSAFRSWLTAYSYLNGCTLLVPKSLFNRVGYFNEKLKHTQDYDLWFRLSYHADFIFHKDVLVDSRQRPDQDSRSKSIEASKEGFLLRKSFLLALSKKELKNNIFVFLKMVYTHRQIKLIWILIKQFFKSIF